MLHCMVCVLNQYALTDPLRFLMHSNIHTHTHTQDGLAGIDYGTMRVCDSKSLPLVIKNTGKYPVNYAFTLRNAQVSEHAQGLDWLLVLVLTQDTWIGRKGTRCLPLLFKLCALCFDCGCVIFHHAGA